MSLLEGGPLKCGKHKFEAKSVDDWNKHWTKYGVDEGHYEEGTTACTGCGAIVEYSKLPPHPFVNGSKNITLQCEDCQKQTKGVTIKKVGGKK